jgi:hypothetical protein
MRARAQRFWMSSERTELRGDRGPGESPASLPLPCQGKRPCLGGEKFTFSMF